MPEDKISKVGYDVKVQAAESFLELLVGSFQTIFAAETCQTDDYDNYNMSMFNADNGKQRHKDAFPIDCQKAYELGAEISQGLLQ